MCSRYALTAPPAAVRSFFKLTTLFDFPPRYNIAPTQPILIVRAGATVPREPLLARWGLIPSWVKDPAKFTTLINARAETVAEKPSFRGAMRHFRCLIPATAFYEWTGPAGRKQPHLIRARGGDLFAFAGLWTPWAGADGSEIDTAAIITVPANGPISALHDRMPAILAPADYEGWLDVRGVDVAAAAALLRPAPDDDVETFPVSPRLNQARNDDVALQAPVAERVDEDPPRLL
jgi:putative SOS response-associated peptidase YedK